MHVLIAPDTFGTDLTATEVGAAIAEGWSLGAPHDTVELAPMSAGGAGFVDALHGALGGQLLLTSVRGLAGAEVPATILRISDDAYVEAAQAAGRQLGADATDPVDPWAASSAGVGELIGRAIDSGAARVIVALGEVGTNDAGAGLLAALGAVPAEPLLAGPRGMGTVAGVDLATARARVAGVELVAAADVDNPLLGFRGTTNVFGASRGIAAADLAAVDAALGHFAAQVDAELAATAGAGAGGGLAYALAVLGARRRPALDLVVELVDLEAKARRADLVVTAARHFDGASLRGAVIAGVAHTTGLTGRPCIVLADLVEVGRREMNAYGIESAYAIDELARGGSAGSAAALAALAARVARSWSPGH